MRLRDWTFQRVFSNMFVYNILYEDTDVDEQFLRVNENSRVLGISGAGCGMANHISRRPRRVDAVDINKHHLALTALKISAAQNIESWEEFYALFGWGFHPRAEAALSRLLTPLPRWIQKHWYERRRMFSRSVYEWGLTAQLFTVIRKLSGLNGAWMRSVMKLPVEERKRQVKESLEPVLRSPWMKVILNSPINLLALGVNFTQCERMMSPDQDDLVDFLVMHITRVAETDLETNWFAWHSIAGHMNHDNPLGVPPFVRFDHHQSSLNSPTVVNYHHKNLFDVLRDAGANTWTHYTLCDAVDWMPHDVQKKLLSEIIRTSEDGAIMLYRSVEDDSLAARHGLEKHIRLLADDSAQASKMDRTRQYLRVNFYQIVH